MTSLMRVFLDSMLIENPVFMTFVGALAAVVLPRTARTSYAPGLRLGVAFFFVGFGGAVTAAAGPEVFVPAVYVLAAGIGIVPLVKAGDLSGEALGVPSALLIAAPLIGVQLLLTAQGDLARIVAGAAGNALGFSAAYIIIGAVRETVLLAEAKKIYKTNPVILFTMAMFAVVMSGFLFW